MLKLAEPDWLMTLWIIGAIGVLGLISFSFFDRKVKKYFNPKKTGFLISSMSLTKKRWHLILQVLAASCFVVALSRPLMGSRRTEVKQTGIEIIFALDVSNSMLAEDDKPSRLEHAKHELIHLLDLLSGDRVGVIAFAGSAVLVSPMTTDHSAIKMYLSSLSPSSVSTQGTNIKDVVEEAERAFERGGVEAINGAKPTRVVLIASDGEDNEVGGLDAVKKAAKSGIHIFALGFGSARGAPIPLRDERGNLTGYKKDKSGQPILSRPSDEALSRMTQAGNGGYYHSTFDEAEVRSLYSDLNKLQKAEFKSQVATDFDEKFQIPLALGIFLALIDFLFSDRKNPSRLWKGRFREWNT